MKVSFCKFIILWVRNGTLILLVTFFCNLVYLTCSISALFIYVLFNTMAHYLVTSKSGCHMDESLSLSKRSFQNLAFLSNTDLLGIIKQPSQPLRVDIIYGSDQLNGTVFSRMPTSEFPILAQNSCCNYQWHNNVLFNFSQVISVNIKNQHK